MNGQPAPLPTRDQREMSLYFSEAALLRTCLAYNEDDFRFANPGDGGPQGKIVYIFDANIAAFFLQPERENERRKVIAFRSDGRARSYASATALITAEYLFSRQLAGQRNNPALIAPTHGDDLADILDKIQAELAEHHADDVNDANIAHIEGRLAQIVARIQDRSFADLGAVASELRKFVPRLADELENRFAPIQQLDRIYREDLLRPLALHTAATLDILQPSTREIDLWARLIGRERERQSKSATRNKCVRDATALVQAMMLDRQAHEAQDPGSGRDAHAADPLRYVLVTADMALYDAYTQWYWTIDPDLRPRFVLRLPIQYVPILNTFEMPNSLHDDEVTRKAFLALDSLFGNLKDVDRNYERKLAYYRINHHSRLETTSLFGKDPFDIGIDAFSAARDEWNACYMNGVILNAPLMQRRHAKAFEGLVRALSRTPALREALAREQVESLSRIVGAHAGFVTPATAHDLLGDLREGRSIHVPAHRMPFLFRLEGTGLPASVITLLAGERTPTSEALERDLRETIGTSQTPRSLLLAAMVAFRKGHWVGARAFARHALSRDAPDAIRFELRYLAAISTRHMLGTAQELEPLVTPLDEARADLAISLREAEAAGDTCVVLRTGIERQALLLTLCRLGLHGPLSAPSELHGDVDGTPAILREALALIEDERFACDGPFGAALVASARRVALGAAAQIVLAGVRTGTWPIARETLRPIVARVLTGEAEDAMRAPIHQLHRAVARWFVGEIDDAALRTMAAGFLDGHTPEEWISPLDRREIANMLDLPAAGAPPAFAAATIPLMSR